MPQFALAEPERKIVVSWLFEPNGYLDYATRVSDEMTARETLAENPDLDITQWCRDNPLEEPEMYECGMVWWIWKMSNVNIPPPQRPPETADWIGILEGWDTSIEAAWGRKSQADRDVGNPINIFGKDGQVLETMPGGAQLAHQQSLISKVLKVLQ